MKKSIISLAVLAASVGGFASSASAVSVDWSQDSGYVFNSVTPQTGGIANAGPVGAMGGDARYDALWWGNSNPARGTTSAVSPIATVIDGANNVVSATAAAFTTDATPESSVKVVSLNSGPGVNMLTSGAGYIPISHVFHSNQTISSDSSGLLTSGIVRSDLTIDGNLTGINDVLFKFFETPNNDSNYNCPDNSGISCDIFQLATGGFASTPINIGGTNYSLSFALIGVSPNAFVINPGDTWGNSSCQAGNFCMLSKEGFVNYFSVGMRLDEVPEPGSLALLGLGLFGMGAAFRRRKTND